MSINKELKILHEEILNSLPPEVSKQLIIENKILFTSFLEEKALKEGSVVPNVLFRDKNLKSVYLWDLLKEHHIVLSFFRGTWCPYCNLELKALNKIEEEIREKGALLIAVTPELYEYSEDIIKKNEIKLTVMTDLGNKAAEKFGLVFELPEKYREIYKSLNIYINILNGEDKWTLPMPATFIISKDGIAVSTFINADYTQRMERDEILEQLNLLNLSEK